jgi:hypothetical protein
MNETQHILTPIKFGLLGFAISIHVKGLVKSGMLPINKTVLEFHRSTQPTEIYLIVFLPNLSSPTGFRQCNRLNLQGIAA